MSRVRLGELLLTRGLCTRDQLSQAWEQKVVYGDRLGTNLLALGVIDETALAMVLGVQHGVHAGYGAVLKVDPEAVDKVSRTLAIKRSVVPHHIADRTLYLLMKDPDDLRAIDDVRFATRLKVQPVAVCEARLWRLLSEHYGHKSPLRPNPIDIVKRPAATTAAEAPKPVVEDLVSEEEFQLLYARLASGSAGDVEARDALGELKVDPKTKAAEKAPDKSETTTTTTTTTPASAAPASSAPASSAPVDDPFADEVTAPPVADPPEWIEATRPIRMRLVAGTAIEAERFLGTAEEQATTTTTTTTTTAPTSTSTTLTKQSPSLSPLEASVAAAALAAPPAGSVNTDDWQRVVEETNPMRAIPKLANLIDQMQALEEIDLVEVADEDPDSLPPESADGPSPFSVARTTTSVIVPAPDLSPLSFDEAVALLKTAKGRDDIARVVLRAARAHFTRACLITVYPHAFVGWQGVGEGFDTEKLVDIALPRNVPSVFALVADSRAHYLGPLQRFTAHGAWVKATGKKIPKSVAVLPILVRGRVVNLLVVDNGHDQHVGSDVGGLLILAQHIAGTYEKLIQRG